MIIGVTTDFLFPIYQQHELAEGLKRPGREVQFHELDSLQGHDSFLVDMDRYRPLLAELLRVTPRSAWFRACARLEGVC